MKQREQTAFEHFIKAYKLQWDLNSYYREEYNEDLEYYINYRDENEYPLAYDMFFPLLLPRIQTMLARMLGQLYQGGASDFVGVRPRQRQDIAAAPKVAGLLNFQLEHLNDIDMQGGSYLFHLQWMLNALSWGKGIAKVYWRKEERIAPLRRTIPVPEFDEAGRLVGVTPRSIMLKAPQIVYDAPYAEVIHNKLFVPHPYYKSIQKMPFVFCVYRRSVDYLKEMERKGVYRNVKEIGWNSEVGETTSGDSSVNSAEHSGEAFAKSIGLEGVFEGKFQSERYAPEVDVVEGYGKYIFPEDDSPYEVGSGVKIKGKQSEAIVHIGNYKTLLKLQKNEYGYRPFFDIGAYWHPELFWDVGIIRLGKAIQEQYNTLANTRYQGALQNVAPMLQVRYDSDIPPEALIFKPFGIVPVSEINMDVAPLQVPDTYRDTFREQEEFFKSTIEDMTGMYRYNMGETPSRQEHVGTIVSLQQMGESRVKLLLMGMDYMGFQPMLKYMMMLNQWHLPDGFETRITNQEGDQFVPLFSQEVHPYYDFSARYTAMEPALSKHFRVQQLLQFYQIWAQTPYLQHYEFIKAIMEMFDFYNTDRFLKSPQQVAQEQQMMAAQSAKMQMQQMALEDQMNANQSSRDMQRDIVKGLLK